MICIGKTIFENRFRNKYIYVYVVEIYIDCTSLIICEIIDKFTLKNLYLDRKTLSIINIYRTTTFLLIIIHKIGIYNIYLIILS